MDVDSKRLLVVVPNEVPQRQVLDSSDVETWKCYLESPLTAATKAMMSINGDDDSAAALSMLYDYYKVSREKKAVAKPTVVLDNYDMLDQALNSMPVNLSLHSTEPADHSKNLYGPPDVPIDAKGHTRKGSGGTVLVKAETPTPIPSNIYKEEPQDTIRMVYEQSRYDSLFAGSLREEQSNTPDSAYEDEVFQNTCSGGTDQLHYNAPIDGFQYCLEASMSLRPRQGDGPMAYLNRGQFYPLTLSQMQGGKVQSRGMSLPGTKQGGAELQQDSVVQSVIMVVFGEDKCRDEQLKNWKYWHSRQHTAKQRVLDIADYKESFSTISNVEEIAYNAVSFTWDVTEEAKVFISVNCLSTDFSSQKGVKGTPLKIQIDTYSYNGSNRKPIHRAYSEIKVFCDKGAERKLRDEEKKQLRKRTKGKSGSCSSLTPLKRSDITLFKSERDLDSQPVLFIPDAHFGNLQRSGQVRPIDITEVFAFNTEEVDSDGSVMVRRISCVSEEELCPPQKRHKPEKRVLLYVRKESDEVFDALMLRTPTLKALMEAISEKYAVPVDKMAKVYQKSKKGVLVNMDDNIIQHYSNEDTFILAIETSADSLRIILSEI